MTRRRKLLLAGAVVASMAGLAWAWQANVFRANPAIDFSGPIGGWDAWGNDQGGSRYSPLTQITPENAWALKPAWTYHIGMAKDAPEFSSPTFEATPIIAENRLYVCAGTGKIAAVDPETGKEIWAVQPDSDNYSTYLINCRGVTYARDVKIEEGQLCAGKIFAGTLDGRMLAYDSATGKECPSFGANGVVDIKADMGKRERGDITISSPPVVVGNLVVTNHGVRDNVRTDMPAGTIRAFDVHTGQPVWSWNAVPPGTKEAPVPPAGEKFVRSTPNSWAPMSVDPALNLIYVPMGNAPPDHIAAGRNGLDYYSSAVVALDATTGEVRWHFNTVHKDVWDYDIPSQPVLFDLPTANGTIPALVQATKVGHIFVLDRRTGKPLFPVEERPVPQSTLPGEVLSPTQPFPANPAFIVRDPDLTENDMWGFTPYDKYKCKEAFNSVDSKGIFTPPSTNGWVQFPSFMGASNWGSVTVDQKRGILIANTNQVAAIMKLVPNAEIESRTKAGERIMPTKGADYGLSMLPLLSPFGAPCNRPPWGKLMAIDLKAGKVLWNVPLGTTRDQAPFPAWFKIGVPNMGGSIVTGSGLVFIGATSDEYIRGYDIKSGEVVWRARLPAGGQSTPMTYRLTKNGRQYVVIAAGGHKFMGTGLGDSLVAFALPDGS